MRNGFSIIRWSTDHFRQVEVLEQCGEFFKLRVPKEDKTIGWLFGQLEQEKNNLGIQEYSVSQTTLEQIFQVFANQSIASDKAAFTFIKQDDRLQLVNPDHKMTEEQERLSQRGLSFVAERDEFIKDHHLPFHPLKSKGYSSIGCFHCTVPGDDRHGRWNNSPKTECGLHL